jgi:DNA polymerase type B, organellar and viral
MPNPLKQNHSIKILLNTFVTIDIETIKINNKLIPYLICGYNGSNFITSYTNNTLDQMELFKSFMNQLFTFFTEDSNTLIVYAHNFSSFDGLFILEHLLDFGKVDPLLFNGKLISIKLKLNIKGYKNKTIIFKDSMLLLPPSLRDLCKAFNIVESKGVFPMNLNDINYSSEFPSFKYFTDLSLQEYLLILNNYNNKIWNFKDEAIKYCKLDSKCLFEVLIKFNELIFNEFSIDAHKVLTLPALTMIKTQTYTLHNLLLTNEVLGSYINHFWNDIFTPIQESKHLMLMCKVEFTDSALGYRTLGHLRIVNFDNKELFIEYLTLRLGLLTESYTTHPISKITFSYIIKDGLATGNRALLKDLNEKSSTTHRFNNMNLPISMNPSDYGEIIVDNYVQTGGVNLHRFMVESGNRTYRIDVSNNGLTNNVKIQGAIDLSWIDTKISDEVFKREIGKSIIYFMGGERVLRKLQLNAKPFTKVATDSELNSKFVTMDVETIKLQGKITPYLICGYNGSDFISSYANIVNGLIDQKALFAAFINQLLTFFTTDSKNLVVYAHNFSGFYGIFLLKHLLFYGKVEPLIFNGKLMSIKVILNTEGCKGKTIIFKDSFLLLPLSLRKLCAAFNITAPKGHFPFLLTDIFYSGVLPKLALWIGLTINDYETLVGKFKGKVWNFKDESIKYCKLDCQCLHEILTSFNELIFKHFKLNINISLTLPALAMRIYKSQFMPEGKIYQLLGRVEQAIRESYTGGAVDVFIPHNKKESFFSKFFIKLYSYDVNSLYPTIMAKTLMPIGKPIYFEGDIRQYESNAFGFFYCKITSPEYLEHPILQRRIKTANGVRTIAGLGGSAGSGWIFSGEMDNAVKFGYQFEILNGYQFESGDIFSEFINKMFTLRQEYVKGHAMNLIAKLLMNSLYGKFGMKMDVTRVDIFDISCETEAGIFKDMVDVWGESIQDTIKLDNYVVIVRDSRVDLVFNDKEDMYHGLDVNIAIASAITSGARMWMSVFKNSSNFKLFYSDTDNIVVDRPLPSFMVGNGLGQFKLEYVIERAVFLAPKVYGLITTEGKEIIKVKGINQDLVSDIHIIDLEKLMIKDSSSEYNQEKWFKKVIEGDLIVQDIAYTLKVTSNKRNPIYIDNVYENTKPYNYDEIGKK